MQKKAQNIIDNLKSQLAEIDKAPPKAFNEDIWYIKIHIIII